MSLQRESLDNKLRILKIGDNISLSLSEETLRNSGDFFKAMLDPSYSFKEFSQDTITISNELVPNLGMGETVWRPEQQDWEKYFCFIDSILDKETELAKKNREDMGLNDRFEFWAMSLEEKYTFSVIADFLHNLDLKSQLLSSVKEQMSSEALPDYLKNWWQYYRIFTCFYPDKLDNLFLHLERRINNTNTEAIDNLVEFGISMMDYILVDKTIDSILEYLRFFRIFWKNLHWYLPSYTASNMLRYTSAYTESNKLLLDPLQYCLHNKLAQSETFIPYRCYTPIRRSTQLDLETHTAIGELNVQFSENWQNLTYGLLDDINWDGMVLAGGSVNKLLRILTQSDNVLKMGPQTDLDLFLIGSEDEQREKLIYLLTHFSSKYGDKLFIGHKKSIISIWVVGISRMIQIISSQSKCIFDTLYQFDLTHSQVAYDGTRFYATPFAIESLITGVTQQSSDTYVPSLDRIFKAHTQGYTTYVSNGQAKRFMELDDKQITSKREKIFYKYFFPTDCPLDKNKFELKNHYNVDTIYSSEELNIPELVHNIMLVGDFRRDYDTCIDGRTSLVDIDPKHFKMDYGLPDTRMNMIKLSYQDHLLVLNLRNLNVLYYNNKTINNANFRELVLKLDGKNLDILKKIDDVVLKKILEVDSIRQAIIGKKNIWTDEITKESLSPLVKDAYSDKAYIMKIKLNDKTEIEHGYNNISNDQLEDYMEHMSDMGCVEGVNVDITLQIPNMCIMSHNHIAYVKKVTKITISDTRTPLKEILAT